MKRKAIDEVTMSFENNRVATAAQRCETFTDVYNNSQWFNPLSPLPVPSNDRVDNPLHEHKTSDISFPWKDHHHCIGD